MDQPAQRVDVDVVEPARREAHHVLLFIVTATAEGTRAHVEAEEPVPVLWVAGHGLTPTCGRCMAVVRLCADGIGGTSSGHQGSIYCIAVAGGAQPDILAAREHGAPLSGQETNSGC